MLLVVSNDICSCLSHSGTIMMNFTDILEDLSTPSFEDASPESRSFTCARSPGNVDNRAVKLCHAGVVVSLPELRPRGMVSPGGATVG